MEIKAILEKPYTEEQRVDFIVEQNHNLNYEIRETETELQAWGLDEGELIEQKKYNTRYVRNRYLSETDIYMIVDFPISDEEKELYKQYRQYLREYTNTEKWYEQNPLTFEDWKQMI